MVATVVSSVFAVVISDERAVLAKLSCVDVAILVEAALVVTVHLDGAPEGSPAAPQRVCRPGMQSVKTQ